MMFSMGSIFIPNSIKIDRMLLPKAIVSFGKNPYKRFQSVEKILVWFDVIIEYGK